MIYFSIVQFILLFFMALHDWVDIPPFTNLAALKKAHTFRFRLIGSIVNATLVAVTLLITLFYYSSSLPFWASLLFTTIYGLLTVGTIAAWWIPYLGGR